MWIAVYRVAELEVVGTIFIWGLRFRVQENEAKNSEKFVIVHDGARIKYKLMGFMVYF
jgi:hypothetical protein